MKTCYLVASSMSNTQIHIRSGLSLALIVNNLLFLSVPAGTCVRVFVCVLAPGGHDWHCGAALQTSILATCPTNTKNTGHSFDPYILYQQSSGGHTSKSSNNYLRQGCLFAACCEYPIIHSVWRGGVWEEVWHTHTCTFSCKQECIHINACTSGSWRCNRWQIRVTQT